MCRNIQVSFEKEIPEDFTIAEYAGYCVSLDGVMTLPKTQRKSRRLQIQNSKYKKIEQQVFIKIATIVGVSNARIIIGSRFDGYLTKNTDIKDQLQNHILSNKRYEPLRHLEDECSTPTYYETYTDTEDDLSNM